MNCEYCEWKKKEIICEDEKIVALVKDHGLTPGQIAIFPKEHFTILELVPEDVLAHCAVIANKLGVAVFESLGCQGTNILIQNGLAADQKIPHWGIEIIPRREGDGLNLLWEPKPLMEDEMEMAFQVLKEELEKPEPPKIEPKDEPKVEEKKEEGGSSADEKLDGDTEKENYLLKSLRRRP